LRYSMSVTSFSRRCRSLLSTLCASATWRFRLPTSASDGSESAKLFSNACPDRWGACATWASEGYSKGQQDID